MPMSWSLHDVPERFIMTHGTPIIVRRRRRLGVHRMSLHPRKEFMVVYLKHGAVDREKSCPFIRFLAALFKKIIPKSPGDIVRRLLFVTRFRNRRIWDACRSSPEILGNFSTRVTAVDMHDLVEQARAALRLLGVNQVVFYSRNSTLGWATNTRIPCS